MQTVAPSDQQQKRARRRVVKLLRGSRKQWRLFTHQTNRRWRMIELSEQQMRLVQDGAACVPGAHRPDYLNAVADELQRLEQINDNDVMDAVRRACAVYQTTNNGARP
jgi:hypothetical protein